MVKVHDGTELFQKETTGRLMKQNFITANETNSVKDAVNYVRTNAAQKNNIHYVYILNEDQQLTGVLSLRELLSLEDDYLLRDVMKSDIVFFHSSVDQEVAAKVFQDTDLVSIPVLSKHNLLLGVVHVEDILDVIQFEATEDFHKMATVNTIEGSLKDTTFSFLYRKRVVWLVVLVFMNVFSVAGIAHFEDIIESNIALVFFLPLLVDSGGNAGSQSSTLMIRAMATGEVKASDWLKMFMKEISVALALGLTMAFAVSVVGFYRGGPEIAFVVSLTMVVIVMVGSLIGMSLPFIFNKLKLDAATASGPLITSIADIVGVLIYFSIAANFLSL